MPSRAPVHRPFGGVDSHREQETDRLRGSASARGYDRAWQRVRAAILAAEPLCRFCLADGRTTAAEEVDHIKTIRERPDLRLVRANLRPLCKPCHSRRTASAGASGRGV